MQDRKDEMEEFIVQLSPQEEALRQVIEPLLLSEGFEVLRIKLKKTQNKSLLAIFVDTKAQKNGVVLENLTDISRLLSDVLDASFEDGSVLSDAYDLEVSSPGLDRPLTKLDHFKDAVGERIRVKLSAVGASTTKNIFGKLCEISEDTLVLEAEHIKNEKLAIAFCAIAEANIVFDFAKVKKTTAKANVI